MAWVAMGLGLILLVAAVVACFLMYNVNMRRRNKPNGNELCWMLICPCWSEPYHKELEMSDEEDLAPSALKRSGLMSREVKLDSPKGEAHAPLRIYQASPVGHYVQ